MSNKPGSNGAKSGVQLLELVRAIAAVLGLALALYAVLNNITEKPILSVLVGSIMALVASVWVVRSEWAGIHEVIIAWLALAVVVLAGFVIWPKTMTVKGVIYDAAGNGVSNEEVVLFDSSNRLYKTKTDAEGHYEFRAVPYGRYKLQYRGTEWQGETQGVFVRVLQQDLAVSGPPPVAPTVIPTSPADTPVSPATTDKPTPTETPAPVPPTETPVPMPTDTRLPANVHITHIESKPEGSNTDEYVNIENFEKSSVNMTRWTLRDDKDHTFVFPTFTLNPGASVQVWVKDGTDTAKELYWGLGQPVWNDDRDCAYLRDTQGQEVSQKCY